MNLTAGVAGAVSAGPSGLVNEVNNQSQEV